ncbi:MAG: hypothetical protein KF767_19050 [Bdellovibrionaceae bacterium]|nr:hypothetical protein [Pseudobdellovibrionaceae bacterium]
MKLAAERKTPSLLGMFFLFAILSLLLGVESRAETKLTEAIRLPLGPGSVIEFMDDFDFGLSREKRFCDGQDTGFFRSLMSQDCCTIRINPLEAPLTQQIVIGRGLRSVKDVSARQNFAVIDGKYEVIMNCGEKSPSAELLKRALGTRVQIHEMKVVTDETVEVPTDGPKSAGAEKTLEERPSLTPVLTI